MPISSPFSYAEVGLSNRSNEISAGCYQDNEYSLRMLKSLGFTRYPDGDEDEVDCFTGKMTVQLEFRLRKSDFPC